MILTAESILKFLKLIDGDFTPSLSEKTNLEMFALKLKEHADLFYDLSEDGEIKALVCMYANDYEKKYAYIPLVGVHPQFRGQGLAAKLLLDAVDFVKAKEGLIKTIGIHSNNPIALKIYGKIGFKTVSEQNGRVYQELSL